MLETTEWMLVVACLLGSLISVSTGTSYGLSFAAMATVLPPTTALALHGLTEGISSGFRWITLLRFVNYRYLTGFVTGGIIGLGIGWPLLGVFSDRALSLMLGLFLLATLWMPLSRFRLSSFAGGACTSCLTVLVGATGPMVAALVGRKVKGHRMVVGTQGACTFFQHWGKVLVFALAGFSFSQHLMLIIALSAATIVGTLIGKQFLIKIPVQNLHSTLRAIVTILGMRMVLIGLGFQLDEAPKLSLTGILLGLLLLTGSCYVVYMVKNLRS